ncbi:MAG: hypothetical protein K0Q55_110 [Verrucomicrobia bacterium]|jgi:hypothetical protein|nr:hypothetical protein [Verrucomicrobiota bacterium]
MTFHPSFKFMLVYEDRDAGIRAKEMSDRLASMIEPDCHVTNEAWNFALLHDPQLREVAAAEAREAHMVIISARSVDVLPPHVKSWLGEWLPARSAGKAALVFLLGDQDQPASQYTIVHDDLKNLTSINEMDFFCVPPPKKASLPPNVIPLPGLSSQEQFSDVV